MRRREFLIASSAALAPLQAARLPITKGVYSGMLPKDLSWAERFQVAKRAGFQEVEVATAADDAEAKQIKAASEASGLRVHSVMNVAHGKYPIASPDPAVVAESMKGLEMSLRQAHLFKSDTVLLVAGFVTDSIGYKDVWVRSEREIRKILPLAAELKVIIALENVGRFLLSPLEFAQFVDSFNSPYFKAYFDVGNILRFGGFPQDWIRVLGKRIVKLHFKDPDTRRTPGSGGRPPLLGEGEVNWKAVREAILEVGYRGSATVELAGGDEEYLKDVVRRFDKIIEGV
jgi:hexulose-6-phosphate isomerase